MSSYRIGRFLDPVEQTSQTFHVETLSVGSRRNKEKSSSVLEDYSEELVRLGYPTHWVSPMWNTVQGILSHLKFKNTVIVEHCIQKLWDSELFTEVKRVGVLLHLFIISKPLWRDRKGKTRKLTSGRRYTVSVWPKLFRRNVYESVLIVVTITEVFYTSFFSTVNCMFHSGCFISLLIRKDDNIRWLKNNNQELGHSTDLKEDMEVVSKPFLL